MARITKRQTARLIAEYTGEQEALRVLIAGMHDQFAAAPDEAAREAIGARFNAAHDRLRDLDGLIRDAEMAYERRNYTAGDRNTRNLILDNID